MCLSFSRVGTIAALSCWMTICNSASAALIPFPAQQAPDLKADISSVSYNSLTLAFQVAGTPTQFDIPGGPPSAEYDFSSFGGTLTYDINLEVNSLGVFTPGGTIEIKGTITGLAASDLLLKGNIKQLGFGPLEPGNAAKFQFIFDNLSGDLASFYETGEAFVLVSARGTTNYSGGFGNTFSFGASDADNWGFDQPSINTPEPSAQMLLSLGLVGILGVCQRRRRYSGISTSR